MRVPPQEYKNVCIQDAPNTLGSRKTQCVEVLYVLQSQFYETPLCIGTQVLYFHGMIVLSVTDKNFV